MENNLRDLPSEVDCNIATMTADQLEKHVQAIDDKHKRRMTTLRALIRARKAEEDATGGES